MKMSDRELPDDREPSKLVQALRDAPKTYDELPYPPKPRHRKYVVKVAFSTGGKGRGGSPTTVYYLYGDERRAVRRFIDVNDSFVADCMEDDNNPIASQAPEEVWQLFVEEWGWRHSE